jgi:hypothetical protein
LLAGRLFSGPRGASALVGSRGGPQALPAHRVSPAPLLTAPRPCPHPSPRATPARRRTPSTTPRPSWARSPSSASAWGTRRARGGVPPARGKQTPYPPRLLQRGAPVCAKRSSMADPSPSFLSSAPPRHSPLHHHPRSWARRLAARPSSSSLATTAATTPSGTTPRVRRDSLSLSIACARAYERAAAPSSIARPLASRPLPTTRTRPTPPPVSPRPKPPKCRPRRDQRAEPQLCGRPQEPAGGRGGDAHQPERRHVRGHGVPRHEGHDHPGGGWGLCVCVCELVCVSLHVRVSGVSVQGLGCRRSTSPQGPAPGPRVHAQMHTHAGVHTLAHTHSKCQAHTLSCTPHANAHTHTLTHARTAVPPRGVAGPPRRGHLLRVVCGDDEGRRHGGRQRLSAHGGRQRVSAKVAASACAQAH